MTKQLILMRHAKSDAGSADLADHDRPLNKRGRKSAPEMADWLRANDFVPDVVLCSTARRTRETVERMLPRWEQQTPVHYSKSLYLAAPDGLLEVVRSDAMDVRSVMVMAHNPGIESLVGAMTGESHSFPTAAVAVFDVDLETWSQLQLGQPVRCLAVQRPKEL